MFLDCCIATLAIPPIVAVFLFAKERIEKNMKKKKMKRKDLILGLEGILVSSGLSRTEFDIIDQAIERLKDDKDKIKELRKAANANADFYDALFNNTFYEREI